MNKQILLFIIGLFLVNIALADYSIGGIVGTDDSLNYKTNSLLTSKDDMIGMIIPAIMLIVTIVCLAIDWGVIGVAAAFIVSLVGLYFIGLLPVTISGIISLIALAVIIMFKVKY